MKKVLIIGSGGIGKRHIRGFLKTGHAVLSVVEPHDERRAEVERDYEIQKVYGDLAEAELTSFDLAVICAPAHLHVPIMTTCAEAGLPFLVEKPLSVTLDGVDDVLAQIAEKGLEARVGYIRRVSEENRALRAAAQSGEIGKVRLVYMNGSHDFPKARPDYQRTYYAKAAMGGGAILDSASHSIDLLLWMLGPVAEVSCMQDTLVLEGVEGEDTCLINLRFVSGAMGNLVINQFQKRGANTIELIGTEGNLLLDQTRLQKTVGDSGAWGQAQEFLPGLEPMAAHEARFAMQATEMLDALEGKPCCLTTLAEARENLRIALAAKQSWEEKRIISLC